MFSQYLLDVALELFVAYRQSVEELLQGKRCALLARVWAALGQLAIVVKHQARAHLSRLVARHHTQVTEDR